ASDQEGRLIATPEDYQVAQRLLDRAAAWALGSRLSAPALRFHKRLQEWGKEKFSTPEVMTQVQASKSSVHGWLKELLQAGVLDQVEKARGQAPAVWRLSGRVAVETSRYCLPTVEEVFGEGERTPGHNPQVLV